MDRDEVSGSKRCGEAYHPQIEECPSVGAVSRAAEDSATTPRAESTPTPTPETAQVQPGAQAPASAGETPSPAAPRDPDAKFKELLAQAREIMQDPEFMEEVMALARLLQLVGDEFDSKCDGRHMGQVLALLIQRGEARRY